MKSPAVNAAAVAEAEAVDVPLVDAADPVAGADGEGPAADADGGKSNRFTQ